uniref:DYW domain-containing protein n=1 Tax=Kalanchoe fedtschenkoi TaxID=63787 RepID=A0A7N0SV37_KALFE
MAARRRAVFALRPCNFFTLEEARPAHARIIVSDLHGDSRLVTKLLSIYASSSKFEECGLVLDSVAAPTLFSFSALIHASSKLRCFDWVLRFFSRMLDSGIVPDAHVLPSVVKACAGISSSGLGKQVHGFAVASGSWWDTFVQSSLVHLYINYGEMGNARKVLGLMSEPDVVSWSALAGGYARNGCADEVEKVMEEMQKSGVQPNLVTWNGIVAGFNQYGLYPEAMIMLQRMHSVGFRPDGSSICSVLPAIGSLEKLEMGRQVHSYVTKEALGCDPCVISALIDMYGKCACSLDMSKVFDEMDQTDVGVCNAYVAGLARNGLAEDALTIFQKMKEEKVELNVISWTSMIACCSQNGKDVEALDLVREMQNHGVAPNAVTIPCMLPACGNIAALMHGKAAHCFSLRRGITNDVYVGSALIDMYAKCGKIKDSRLCFDGLPQKNLVSWNAILGGYAMHGKCKEALEIFNSMQKNRQKPDHISFTCILSACSQNGLTKEGWDYFNSMIGEHGIEARMEHYACMVSLLGRVGKLQEAYSLIQRMPYKPDGCIWGALLSSSRTYNNLNLGEIAANELFELEPNNPGNYVLLSNIYASKGLWNEVNKVRNTMASLGLRKNPGCSWIEIKNTVHMLLAGDTSHPQMSEIIKKLNDLGMEMKKAGYLPITKFVLQDVEEQDKEQMLCGHSEKLAVVFGLLNTTQGSALRVIKNLRICGDCHMFMKFISKYEGREIFVRDTNRFHHFENGACSCEDHW